MYLYNYRRRYALGDIFKNYFLIARRRQCTFENKTFLDLSQYSRDHSANVHCVVTVSYAKNYEI